MRSLSRIAAAAMLLAAVALTQGCANRIPNPVASAERPETVALALYGTTTIALERVADIVENHATPAVARYALIDASERVAPVLDPLKELGQEAERIRGEVAAGETQEDKLAVILARLNQWITDVAPKIRAFTDAFTKEKQP